MASSDLRLGQKVTSTEPLAYYRSSCGTVNRPRWDADNDLSRCYRLRYYGSRSDGGARTNYNSRQYDGAHTNKSTGIDPNSTGSLASRVVCHERDSRADDDAVRHKDKFRRLIVEQAIMAYVTMADVYAHPAQQPHTKTPPENQADSDAEYLGAEDSSIRRCPLALKVFEV